MPDTQSAKNGAEVLLEQLESHGVDCVFASPIAVMAPIWEALAGRGNDMKLRYFRCRHELLAVSLASGYYKATGRSQVVFLPTSLGVQNGAMALSTAMQERTPMTVLSPDTLTYGEDPNADPGPEWPPFLTDHPGPARNAEAVVKWSKRARTASDLVYELRRACFIADSEPSGPTLLEIPFDLLMGEGHGEIPPWASPAPMAATPDQIDQVAGILASAANPIIVTEHGGRTDDDREALIRIAETLSAPVFEFWMPAYHNFPRSHPLYGAGPVEAVLGEADAILLAACDGPWHPPRLVAPRMRRHSPRARPLAPARGVLGLPHHAHNSRKCVAQPGCAGCQSPNAIDATARTGRALGRLYARRSRHWDRGSPGIVFAGN